MGGEYDLTERTLPHLGGWRRSRPVRIGNAGWDQRQLDVYGEMPGAVYRVPDWEQARERIREAILTEGWSDRAGAFMQSFGDDALDASNLVMPMVGFLSASGECVRATIEATATRLTDARGLVYRYRREDGLEGGEGIFLLCTFWLAEALASLGDTARARETFEAAIRRANDLGLLSEEVDPETGELIGNCSQAFSHIGLVNAAWAIAQAESD